MIQINIHPTTPSNSSTGQRAQHLEADFDAKTDAEGDGRWKSQHSAQVAFMFEHQRSGEVAEQQPKVQIWQQFDCSRKKEKE